MTDTVNALPEVGESLARRVLARTSQDLGLVFGKDLRCDEPRLERVSARPAGPGRIHISFKLAFRRDGGDEHVGCLLVPLPDAIVLASTLLMVPEEKIESRRQEETLDASQKDALLELGSLIGEAANSALQDVGLEGWSARSQGCQGVRADVRPAFAYPEGSELVVARATTHLGSFPAFQVLLMLPVLPD